MSSSKKTVLLTDDVDIDELAHGLAVESLTNDKYVRLREQEIQNLLNEEWISRLEYPKLKEFYKVELTKRKNQNISYNELSSYYPYYSFTDTTHHETKLNALRKFLVDERRGYSEEELSENDMKLQSLLMLRQYLRMLRRLKGLTYFYSNKNDEVTTFKKGKIHYNFPVHRSTLDRIANSMYLAGYNLHQLHWSTPAI